MGFGFGYYSFVFREIEIGEILFMYFYLIVL